MANEVDYLPVANGPGSIAESQATWVSDLEGPLVNGFPSGIVTSPRFNKVLRQTSMMAAAVANFISTQLNINVLDDGNLPALITNLTNAITALAQSAGATQAWVTTYVANAISALGTLATEAWVNAQSFATQAWVNAQGFATQSWVTSQITSQNAASISQPSRAAGTLYQNTTGANIMVSVTISGAGQNATLSAGATSGLGTTLAYASVDDAGVSANIPMIGIVPPGWYYEITGSAGLSHWTETTF